MSGPMAAGFDLGTGVVMAAAAIAQGMAEIHAEMDEADRQAEAQRLQRKAERRQMRAAQAAGGAQRQQTAAFRAQLAGLLAVVDGSGTAQAAARAASLAAAGDSLPAQLAAHLAQVRQTVVADAAAARRALVARVLERLQLDDDTPLPPAFEALAREIVAAPSDPRAEALATELRLQVQTWNTERAAAAELRLRQDAAAIVLEQSLRDLGYAVEDIEETLFVEGGVAHFQKPGWDDYFIRLRIDPKRGAMNFNVVRAATSGGAGEDRQREDMLAEERWCSEFPKLFETLKARGIDIAVTRLLQAGEAPVQVVAAASLPARSEAEQRHATLKARSLP